jgi:hypothetical protein
MEWNFTDSLATLNDSGLVACDEDFCAINFEKMEELQLLAQIIEVKGRILKILIKKQFSAFCPCLF